MSKTWDQMDTQERNTTLGKMLGTDPFRQVFALRDGERVLNTAYQSIKDLEDNLDWFNEDKARWKRFTSKRDLPSLKGAKREDLVAREHVWWPRYSDTPGGAWMVIEALAPRGWRWTVQELDAGWRASVELPGQIASQDADTVSEAIARLAFDLLKANPA